MNKNTLDDLKLDVSLKAKNGINFVAGAATIWFAIAFLWTLNFSSYNKSVFTFILGSVLLPLAFILSKVFKTQWTVEGNPLQPLGLWLNFAQLFYFPFLVFILLKEPDYFLMTYAIITGAHLFPYAWFYQEKGFALMAGIISIGAMAMGLYLSIDKMYIIALFTGASLAILGFWIFFSFKAKSKLALQ